MCVHVCAELEKLFAAVPVSRDSRFGSSYTVRSPRELVRARYSKDVPGSWKPTIEKVKWLESKQCKYFGGLTQEAGLY